MTPYDISTVSLEIPPTFVAAAAAAAAEESSLEPRRKNAKIQALVNEIVYDSVSHTEG